MKRMPRHRDSIDSVIPAAARRGYVARPAGAAAIIARVARWVGAQEQVVLASSDPDLPDDIEALLHDYFELSPTLRQIVGEVAMHVLPNMQPTSVDHVVSTLQAAPTSEEMTAYAQTLVAELERSRSQLGGHGAFEARIDFYRPGRLEGLGRVTMRALSEPARRSEINTEIIHSVLDDLGRHGLLAGLIDGAWVCAVTCSSSRARTSILPSH